MPIRENTRRRTVNGRTNTLGSIASGSENNRGHDIRLSIVALPESVEGITGQMQRDSYWILINEKLCLLHQAFAIGHELAHIFLGHFNGQCNCQLENMEHEADRKAWSFFRLYRSGAISVKGVRL